MYQKNSQSWMKHGDFILLDILCLNLAFAAACVTRNGWAWPYHDRNYLNLALVLTILDLVAVIIGQTMKNVLGRGLYQEFSRTVKHVLMVELLSVFYLFLIKETTMYSRVILISFAVDYIVLSYLVRLWWKTRLAKRPVKARKALYIVSTKRRVEDVIQRYRTDRMAKYKITGLCLLDEDRTGEDIGGTPITASKDTVLNVLCREWVDEVVLSIPRDEEYPSDWFDELVDSLIEMGIVVHIELEQSNKLGWKMQVVEKLAERQVLTVGMSMATPTQICLKRMMDIAGGLVGCGLTLILTVVLGPMIYLKSPGPIFFSQTRVGKNGKPFKMYKFRSMYLDAEERKKELMAQNRISDGLMFKLDFDPRIIGCEQRPDGTIKKGIGNYIRDWSLDEFPQFLNCLKGDLSLVGTRPPTMDEWEKYELHHRGRLAIKPGITGMWQVSGRSSITDFEQVVELDKQYIQNWSIGLDIKILLKTVKAVLGKEGSM